MSRRTLLATLLILALTAVSGSAFAGGGMLLATTQAPAGLQEQIATARVQDPGAFDLVRRIVEDAPRLAALTRNRRAMLTPHLRDVGPAALWPLLEYVAFVAPDRASFTDAQWTDAQCGILEAAGMIRDARALPTFDAVLADPRQAAAVTRFAAEAVGRLGSDEAAATLRNRLAAAQGERRTAILTGMGQCRRAAMASLLGAELRRARSADDRRAVIQALRDVGNAWAWETPAIAASGEGRQTRRIAAAALVDAFGGFSAAERESAAKALLVVDAPETTALLQQARARADASLAAALDRLIARLAHSPLRR